MADKPTDILNRLITETDDLSEHYLKVSRDFWDEAAEEEEYDALNTEFRHEYEAVAQQIAQDWGGPDFQGDWEAQGFPVWSQALEMAYWVRGEYLAFVALSHEDKEFPMTVKLGASKQDGTEETA